MYHDTELHQVAEDFLKKLKDGGDPFYKEERVETAALEMSNLAVLKRETHPQYFYGFKPSGRPVFSHDIRLARTFTTSCPTLGQHADRLKTIGIEVSPEPTIWREGVLA
jgi:hypothetical protein